MKNILTVLVLSMAGLILSSCGASYRASQEAERQAIVATLEQCNFNLEITRIIPRGYPSRQSLGEYKLSLKDGVVDTRLPYIGDSYSATFGSEEISIVFKKEKVTVLKDFSLAASQGKYLYQFKGGEGNYKWTVDIQIFDSGSASISCACADGRFMSYYATVVLPDNNSDEETN